MPRAPLLALLLLLVPALPAQAQRVLSDQAQLSLITILPGQPIYTLFGHSAVRVYDPALDLDVTYNYGTFAFGNPLVFGAQFAYGRLDYFLSVQSYPRAAAYYWNVEERAIIEQVLTLSPAQRDAVFRFLERNAQPENRSYRYDFFFDNCSTRIRDVFEAVLGEALQVRALPDPGLSFRRLLDPYLVARPVLHDGMDLGLGRPADRPASAREATFLPLYLMAWFDHATVTIDGTAQPLVARTDTVAWAAERVTREPALPWATLAGWLLLALGLALTGRDVRGGVRPRPLLDGLLYGLTGAAGLVIAFLWFISLHAVTHGNLNLLWAWPTHLLAALALARRRSGRWLRGYLALAALAALAVVLGWPFWPQALPAAVLPLVLLLAVRSAALAYAGSAAPPANPAAS